MAYNAAHPTLGPLAVFAAPAWLGSLIAEHIALIFLAHVGFDRALAMASNIPPLSAIRIWDGSGDDWGT
ncbi:MAG: DUF4260 family protein [Methylovirgula sp.]